MENYNKELLKGLLGLTTLVLSSERISTANDTNKILLITIVTILASVFSSDQLINAVKDVVSGRFHINSPSGEPVLVEEAGKFLPAYYKQETESSLPDLTRREKDVLELMADGLMNKEIAKKLGVTDATVKNHVTSILRKFNAHVRTEAVVTAIKYGLIYRKKHPDYLNLPVNPAERYTN